MATPEVQSASPPRKRRWYQFSLRTLMIVMLLASVGMSWFAVKMQQARRQREAVAAIEAAGGEVTYDYEQLTYDYESIPTDSVELPGPGWLREILGVDFFARPDSVRIGRNEVDACLKKLGAMPNLKSLQLPGVRLTDDQLAHLAQFRQLKSLDLACNMITDDGLAYLAQLSQLTDLNLAGNRITDSGLMHLAQLPQLATLVLDGLPITEVGVEHVKKLNRLQFLALSRTPITANHEAEIQEALPGCVILWCEPNPGPAPAP